jgi:hypothetical protein
MRKLTSVSLLAALTAMTAGCECVQEFEAWKNQTLFGCCSPNTGCAPYGAGYQYAAPQYAAPVASGYDCAGVAADCAGVLMQAPYAGSACPGGLCAPPPQGVIMPGQTVITPGTTVVPGATVVPGPETYAPTM